eukprot:scaffold1767_cov71-Cylindrotheca_fusiformis.AAC.1
MRIYPNRTGYIESLSCHPPLDTHGLDTTRDKRGKNWTMAHVSKLSSRYVVTTHGGGDDDKNARV